MGKRLSSPAGGLGPLLFPFRSLVTVSGHPEPATTSPKQTFHDEYVCCWISLNVCLPISAYVFKQSNDVRVVGHTGLN